MVKDVKGLRVVRITRGSRSYYIIEHKFLWVWVRFTDNTFDTLEEALSRIDYWTCKKEQVWP